jgi:hypothetical protein
VFFSFHAGANLDAFALVDYAVQFRWCRIHRLRFNPITHGPAKVPALFVSGETRGGAIAGPRAGLQGAAVPKKSNFGGFRLLKTPTVPIRVTESSARTREKR